MPSKDHNSLIVAVMGILQMRFAGRNGARNETITSSASIPATDAEGSCHWSSLTICNHLSIKIMQGQTQTAACKKSEYRICSCFHTDHLLYL